MEGENNLTLLKSEGISDKEPAQTTPFSSIEPALSPIEKAETLLKALEEKEKNFRELISRQEAIESRKILSGKGEAGQIQKTAEQILKEKADAEIKLLMDNYYKR